MFPANTKPARTKPKPKHFEVITQVLKNYIGVLRKYIRMLAMWIQSKVETKVKFSLFNMHG